ncbi:MAG: hypothetical protein QOE42_1793, partial [Chloroflexota bacterium]|nr:hypothetical protein [Chloroflexota bacterium]
VGGELLVAPGPSGGTIVTASLPLGTAEAAVGRGLDAGSSLGLDAVETGAGS